MEDYSGAVPQGPNGTAHNRAPRIAVVDAYAGEREQFSMLEEKFGAVIYEHPLGGVEEFLSRAENAEAVVTQSISITFDAEVFRRLPQMKLLVTRNAGFDNIDVQAATKAGVCVAYVPGGSGASVAEFAFAGLLALTRRLREADEDVRAGRWDLSRFLGWDLSGKTMGIVGFGEIGQRVAAIARGFGMRVLVWSRTSKDELVRSFGSRQVTIEELLPAAHVVSLHLALTDETRLFMDDNKLSLLRSDAILINTARGGLVDEAALYNRLSSGELRGAVLDVLTEEPPPSDHPLFGLDNVILGPHVAWFTEETLARRASEARNIVEAFFFGQPRHILNEELFEEMFGPGPRGGV